jgi:hypothetical protein
LYAGNINNQGSLGGDFTLNVYGGSFTGNVSCYEGLAGKVELNLNGGDFSECTSIAGSKTLSCFAYMHSETKKALTGIITDFRIIVEGDVDCDTKVTNRDLTMLIRYLSGYAVNVKQVLADMNGDGKVSNRDAIAIITALAN